MAATKDQFGTFATYCPWYVMPLLSFIRTINAIGKFQTLTFSGRPGGTLKIRSNILWMGFILTFYSYHYHKWNNYYFLVMPSRYNCNHICILIFIQILYFIRSMFSNILLYFHTTMLTRPKESCQLWCILRKQRQCIHVLKMHDVYGKFHQKSNALTEAIVACWWHAPTFHIYKHTHTHTLVYSPKNKINL